MTGSVTQAQIGERTVAAIGGFRGTDERAQLHECLIEVARVGWGERFGKIALCGCVFAFGGLFPYRNRREGKTSGGGSAAAGAADKGI